MAYWLEAHQDLQEHPKTLKLASLMGWEDTDLVVGKLLRFWWWCQRYAEDGDLRKHDDSSLGRAVALNSAEAKRFVEAMVSARWLDRQPYFRVHDWWEYAGRWLQGKYGRDPEKWQRVKALYCEADGVLPNSLQTVSKHSALTKHNQTEHNKTKQQGPAAAGFVLPEWVDPTAWADYLAMRVKIRKPMTDRAKALAVESLKDLKAQGHDPKLVLEQSIVNSWAGVFPLKPGQISRLKPKTPPKPLTARERAVESGAWFKMTAEQRDAIIEAEA